MGTPRMSADQRPRLPMTWTWGNVYPWLRSRPTSSVGLSLATVVGRRMTEGQRMTEGRVKPARWARYSRPLPPRGLTVYQTLQAIRQMGLTASCSQGEFRLNYRHGIE